MCDELRVGSAAQMGGWGERRGQHGALESVESVSPTARVFEHVDATHPFRPELVGLGVDVVRVQACREKEEDGQMKKGETKRPFVCVCVFFSSTKFCQESGVAERDAHASPVFGALARHHTHTYHNRMCRVLVDRKREENDRASR